MTVYVYIAPSAYVIGDVLLANKMLEEGLFDRPPMYQIMMSARRAFGIARMQMSMVAHSVLLGDNVCRSRI